MCVYVFMYTKLKYELDLKSCACVCAHTHPCFFNYVYVLFCFLTDYSISQCIG